MAQLKEVPFDPLAYALAFLSKRSIFAKNSYPQQMLETMVVDAPAVQIKLAHLDITSYVPTSDIVNTFNRHKYNRYRP